jgi:hypothetical protein
MGNGEWGTGGREGEREKGRKGETKERERGRNEREGETKERKVNRELGIKGVLANSPLPITPSPHLPTSPSPLFSGGRLKTILAFGQRD